MKRHFAFLKATGLEPHHQMQFRVITRVGVLPICRDAVGIFFSLNRLGYFMMSSIPLSPLLYYCHLQHDNDTITKTDTGRLLYKYIPLTLLQGFEMVIQGFRVRASWRPNRTAIF